MSAPSPPAETLIDALRRLEGCSRFGARFVTADERETFYSYDEVIRRAKSAAATFQAAGLARGDRVAVILPTSVGFFDTFLGIQLAGGIPAALYPPFRLGKLDEYFRRTRGMLAKIGARFLVTENRIRRILGTGVQGVDTLERVIDVADLLGNQTWNPVEIDPDQPVFLQFSSGTTLEPKAVMISHTNLVSNLAMMKRALVPKDDEELDRGAVCWLPLYHDMGLVGCLYMGLTFPATVTFLGPELFLMRPALWLRTLSRYKSAISPAPHFAFTLCAQKITDDEMQGVDLSHWRAAPNGGEPIDVEGMERFCRRFAPYGFRREAMMPVYGLAEAGLAVSFTGLESGPAVREFERDLLTREGRARSGTGRRITSVGRPLLGVDVQIRDEQERVVADGTVGRIMACGPSITKGYYQDPALTRDVIRNGWLDTGDLGFFHEGELFVSGRAKDLIILRGRNYAPNEIEELLLGIAGLRDGCVVALGAFIEGRGEQLIVLAERGESGGRTDDEIIADVKSRLLTGVALVPYQVEFLAFGTLPRTSSGKLRRQEALKQFLAGELAPPEKVSALLLLREVGKSTLAWTRFRMSKRSGRSD